MPKGAAVSNTIVNRRVDCSRFDSHAGDEQFIVQDFLVRQELRVCQHTIDPKIILYIQEFLLAYSSIGLPRGRATFRDTPHPRVVGVTCYGIPSRPQMVCVIPSEGAREPSREACYTAGVVPANGIWRANV